MSLEGTGAKRDLELISTADWAKKGRRASSWTKKKESICRGTKKKSRRNPVTRSVEAKNANGAGELEMRENSTRLLPLPPSPPLFVLHESHNG